MSWRAPLWGPAPPDRHAPRSRGYPEDPRARGARPHRAEPRPRPTGARRRRGLIRSAPGAADAVVPVPRGAIGADPADPQGDGGGVPGLACRSLGPPLSTREETAHVRCAVGSWAAGVRSGTLCPRDGAPSTARPPPEGVHVTYPLNLVGEGRAYRSAVLVHSAGAGSPGSRAVDSFSSSLRRPRLPERTRRMKGMRS